MEGEIQISKLNDFLFCPYSIYYHRLYEEFDDSIYKDIPQVAGTLKHKNIDVASYSSSKYILQGLSIYSKKYNLTGKIDIYDSKKQTLFERKNKISKVYNGYRYQLYAQYLCMTEMGYEVKRIVLHSLSDNKRSEISIPGSKELKTFDNLLRKIRDFQVKEVPTLEISPEKCKKCIYHELCIFSQY